MAKRQQQPPGRTKGEFVPPTNLMKLVKQIGPGLAAKKLGISTTMIHKSRRENAASRVVDIAAGGLLKDGSAELEAAPLVRATVTTGDVVMVLVSVPRAKLAIVQKFIEGIGAEYTVAAYTLQRRYVL